jgi:hypothetical protein
MVEYAPPNQTKYLKFCIHLLTKGIRKGPDLWSRSWFLTQNNAPVHKAISINHLLTEKPMSTLDHAFTRQILPRATFYVSQN